MKLNEAILQLYPGTNFLKDVLLKDNSDGEGAFIWQWNRPDPQPTQAELEQAWVEWQKSAQDREWKEVGEKIVRKLRASEWSRYMPPNSEMGKEWQQYRQSLMDIPANFDNPDDVVWPAEPIGP